MNIDSIIGRSNFSKWKWKFKRKRVYFMPFKLDASLDPFQVLSSSGNVLVELYGDMLTIYPHYHFDGATYAPDLKSGLEWYAVHDAMCQLAAKYDAITVDMADDAFNPRLRDGAPWHIWIYHPAVRLNRRLNLV